MKKTAKLLFCAAGLAVCLSGFASAYLDPSVMSYMIQIIAGVIVAVGATVGIVWRRAKKKAQAVLNIDENANKEVEEDVVALEDDSPAE